MIIIIIIIKWNCTELKINRIAAHNRPNERQKDLYEFITTKRDSEIIIRNSCYYTMPDTNVTHEKLITLTRNWLLALW